MQDEAIWDGDPARLVAGSMNTIVDTALDDTRIGTQVRRAVPAVPNASEGSYTRVVALCASVVDPTCIPGGAGRENARSRL